MYSKVYTWKRRKKRERKRRESVDVGEKQNCKRHQNWLYNSLFYLFLSLSLSLYFSALLCFALLSHSSLSLFHNAPVLFYPCCFLVKQTNRSSILWHQFGERRTWRSRDFDLFCTCFLLGEKRERSEVGIVLLCMSIGGLGWVIWSTAGPHCWVIGRENQRDLISSPVLLWFWERDGWDFCKDAHSRDVPGDEAGHCGANWIGVGAGEGAIDSPSAESGGVYMLDHVTDAVRGEIIHGNCDHPGEDLLEKTR